MPGGGCSCCSLTAVNCTTVLPAPSDVEFDLDEVRLQVNQIPFTRLTNSEILTDLPKLCHMTEDQRAELVALIL